MFTWTEEKSAKVKWCPYKRRRCMGDMGVVSLVQRSSYCWGTAPFIFIEQQAEWGPESFSRHENKIIFCSCRESNQASSSLLAPAFYRECKMNVQTNMLLFQYLCHADVSTLCNGDSQKKKDHENIPPVSSQMRIVWSDDTWGRSENKSLELTKCN